jgi:hypothetical protein
MATIRRLRGRWQAMVRRRGVPPRCKSFDKRTDATRWARELEAEADRSGWVADTRLAEKTTLGELLTRYRDQVSPTKRSAHTEKSRINAIVRRPIAHRTLAKLTSADVATYRDERLRDVAPATAQGFPGKSCVSRFDGCNRENCRSHLRERKRRHVLRAACGKQAIAAQALEALWDVVRRALREIGLANFLGQQRFESGCEHGLDYSGSPVLMVSLIC